MLALTGGGGSWRIYPGPRGPNSPQLVSGINLGTTKDRTRAGTDKHGYTVDCVVLKLAGGCNFFRFVAIGGRGVAWSRCLL